MTDEEDELLTLYKALEQKDTENGVHITGSQFLLQTAMDDISALTDEEASLKASLQFMQQEQDDIKDHVATCEKHKSRDRADPPKHL